MQFISNNLEFLESSFDKLLTFVNATCRALEGDFDDNAKEELLQSAQAVRLPYLRSEIPRVFEQSNEGVERVIRIVTAMRDLSHRGGDDLIPTDLNQAIRTTIDVSCNEYRFVADVETDLDEELPLVPCQSWEIKQALLNLIVNAAHAIKESVTAGRYERGIITIRTSIKGGNALVTVRDNGAGIPQHIQDSIFTPFFTTKAPGTGTGQGLALVRSIVEGGHNGSVAFKSEVGEGTEFTIKLPLQTEVEQTGEAA
jgi:signal transduction histidine kinase